MRCASCLAEKPESEFHFRKDTGKHRGSCKVCWRTKTDQWAAANTEKRRAIALKWAKANYATIYANKARYRAHDPERMRRWSIENPEKMQACRDRWDAANKDRKAQHAAARRARTRSAVAAWGVAFFIGEAYRLAKLRTQVFGFAWEVDHIVPLAGKTVCGLHVEANLRVVPMTVNRTKGHHTWPGKP